MNPQQTEQRRRECESRHVLSMPFSQRSPYLDLVAKRRGEAARRYLADEIHRQHKLAKVAA